MAAPRVFISSTCYDLKYIRENLKYFVEGLGYEAVLSERGDVFYDPQSHTQDACIKELENCQMFVLIIGGKSGDKYKDTEKSITNMEYQRAAENKIPIFALVKQDVYNEHHVYERNKENKDVDAEKIDYPAVDSTKIFDFINEVRKAPIDNDIVPFSDFNEMSEYLKKQWAGMMFSFLTEQGKESERKAVNSLLTDLKMLGDKSQELLRFITVNVAKEKGEMKISKVDGRDIIRRYYLSIIHTFAMTSGHMMLYMREVVNRNEYPNEWPEFLEESEYFDYVGGEDSSNEGFSAIFIVSNLTSVHTVVGSSSPSGEVIWLDSGWYEEMQIWYREYINMDSKLRSEIIQEMIDEGKDSKTEKT